MEEWKDIKGFEGFYQGSTLGRIKSVDRYVKKRNGYRLVKGKILKQTKTGNHCEYLKVSLSKNNVIKGYRVHKLIAETFIPNPDNLPEINHKNEIKTDNRVENLEWCDRKYNMGYGTIIERRSKKLQKRIIKLSMEGDYIEYYNSVNEAADKNNVLHGNISACCRGKRKSAGGFKWKYAD